MICDQFIGVRPVQLLSALFNSLRDGRQRLILFKALRLTVQIMKAGGALSSSRFFATRR
jgi:hypothetical protein